MSQNSGGKKANAPSAAGVAMAVTGGALLGGVLVYAAKRLYDHVSAESTQNDKGITTVIHPPSSSPSKVCGLNVNFFWGCECCYCAPRKLRICTRAAHELFNLQMMQKTKRKQLTNLEGWWGHSSVNQFVFRFHVKFSGNLKKNGCL